MCSKLHLSNSPSTTCRPSVTRRDHIHSSPLCNNNYASVNILTTVYCHSQDMWSHSLVITCNNTYAAINSFATVHRLSEMNQVTTFTSHYIYTCNNTNLSNSLSIIRYVRDLRSSFTSGCHMSVRAYSLNSVSKRTPQQRNEINIMPH